MKLKKTIGLVLAVCLISVLVMAETSKEKETGQKEREADISASERQQEGSPRVTPDRRGAPVDRRQMHQYQEWRAKQIASHKQALVELEEIKKLAEEEGATRTAEAIQKMIDKKDAEFKQSTERFERRRREGSKRVQQQTGRPSRKGAAEEAAKQKTPEEK